MRTPQMDGREQFGDGRSRARLPDEGHGSHSANLDDLKRDTAELDAGTFSAAQRRCDSEWGSMTRSEWRGEQQRHTWQCSSAESSSAELSDAGWSSARWSSDGVWLLGGFRHDESCSYALRGAPLG